MSSLKAKYIEFELEGKSSSGLTSIWRVDSKTGYCLGRIKWYAPWRKYSYFPSDDIILEKHCLRDIANFCEEMTQKH